MMKRKINDIDGIEIIDGDRGKNYPNGEDFNKEKYCLFLNAKNVTENGFNFQETMFINKEKDELLRKGKLKRSDIVLTTRGTVGNVGYFSSKIPYNNIRINSGMVIIRVRDKKNINPKFLYWALRSKYVQNQINVIKTGSAQPQLPISLINELLVYLPNKEIQDKIIKILSTIDNKIELNNQINDNLLEMCNSIYHNHLKKFSDLIENKRIVDIAQKVVTGKTPSTKKKDFWNGDIPFITIPDMHGQIFTFKTDRTITEIGAQSIIPENSISVSCIATVGLVSINTEVSQTNQQINSIILKNSYDLYYLFEFLSEQEQFMKSIASGSTTYNINKNTFENIEVPYLPKEKLIEFHNIVCKMFERTKFNQEQNLILTQLRDTLLPKLMNGETDLKNIEI